MRPRTSRRGFLRMVGAGALATAGGSLLAGCGESSRGSANQLFGVPDQDWRREPDGTLVNAIETEEGQLALEWLRRL